MKTLVKFEMFLGIILLLAFSVPMTGGMYANMQTEVDIALGHQRPVAPAVAFRYSIFRTAPLEVAKVFGRTPGCADADAELIQATAKAAIEAGLDPAIAAATVGVESGCNAFAVSNRGAIGYFQIMPKVWKDKYDFADSVNLFKRDDNMRVGSQIEAGLIAQYGTADGIRRYNGTGVGCKTCDAGYTSKILSLAGRRE